MWKTHDLFCLQSIITVVSIYARSSFGDYWLALNNAVISAHACVRKIHYKPTLVFCYFPPRWNGISYNFAVAYRFYTNTCDTHTYYETNYIRIEIIAYLLKIASTQVIYSQPTHEIYSFDEHPLSNANSRLAAITREALNFYVLMGVIYSLPYEYQTTRPRDKNRELSCAFAITAPERRKKVGELQCSSELSRSERGCAQEHTQRGQRRC